jgi:hypothetical protein
MHGSGAGGYSTATRKRRQTPRPRGTEETTQSYQNKSFSVPRDAPNHQPTLAGRLFFACAADGGWIFEWKFDFHFVSENGKSSNPLNGGWQ